MAALTDSTAVELRRLLDGGHVSVREVVQAHLERIEAVNRRVNAIVTLDADRALAEAEAADSATGRGPRGPLHGLPIAVKDLVETAGMRTTYGSTIYADHVPAHDAPLARRLREAGAIVVGKTNTPEFGAGSQTFNRVFGATRNPYDLARTAGGSSGGAAAAVATRMIPLADGSDLGGSLRNPASFCNVVGLRPTPGRIPDFEARDLWDPLSVPGPIARTVADVALLLRAMAVPDARTPCSLAALEDAVPELALSGLRIAWSPDLGDLAVERSVVGALEAGLRGLEDGGCRVEPAEPALSDADEVFHVLRAVSFARDLEAEVATHRSEVKDTVVWNVEEGLALDGGRIARAQARRSELFRSMAAFLASYDVLALPASAVEPFPVEIEWPREIEGATCETYLDWMRVCTRISVTAHPAVSVPFAFSEAGLPVGLQLVGRFGEEARLLGIAAAIEAAAGASARTPADR